MLHWYSLGSGSSRGINGSGAVLMACERTILGISPEGRPGCLETSL